MGGLGSGTWHRFDKQETIEELKLIDIRFLKKIGILNSYRSGQLSWSINSQPSGTVGYSCTPDFIKLKFNYRRSSFSEWLPVEQCVYFDKTLCNYGGERYWLLCPNCNRRVGILCAAGKLFLCRYCYKVPYESQNESRSDRIITQKHKLGKRIFAEYSMGRGWGKKKGMHQKTFERLYARYCRLEHQSIIDIEELLNKMESRFD